MHLTKTCYDHKDHSRLKREEMNKIRLYVSILTSALPSFLNTEVSQLTRFATLLPPSETVLYNEDCLKYSLIENCLKHSLLEDCLKYRLIFVSFSLSYTAHLHSEQPHFLFSFFFFCFLSPVSIYTQWDSHFWQKHTWEWTAMFKTSPPGACEQVKIKPCWYARPNNGPWQQKPRTILKENETRGHWPKRMTVVLDIHYRRQMAV